MLADKFGLRPWEIARLSERYIEEVYFHPRDEHGALIVPSKPVTAADFGVRYHPPASFEEELQTLKDLHTTLIGTDKKGKGLVNFRLCEEAMKAKWADGSRQAAYETWKASKKPNGG